ncbi:MAG: thiamine-phosphate kinase, partial [Gammaproteobacteria bacterium]|nr:thiamine-phosphate kinase [Gammaproteobacteria bacterium]
SHLGLGFTVDVSKLPIDANLINELSVNRAIEYALSGGDDYELCFTIPNQLERQFCDELSSASNLAFTCVGEITESHQVLTKGNEIYDLPKEIFKHFE